MLDKVMCGIRRKYCLTGEQIPSHVDFYLFIYFVFGYVDVGSICGKKAFTFEAASKHF